MNNIVAYSGNRVSHTASQLDLIRRTYAVDCTPLEFEQFVAVANRAGLDPLRKQIYAVVYNKDKLDKRRMSIITGIDGYRAIAARGNNYRPDENAPVFEASDALKSETNPQGLIYATVRVYKIGPDRQWHAIAGVAYWDEFVPLKEIWEGGQPSGKFKLDKTGKWYAMPRLMLAKCAEAQALRKGWPDDISGIYTEDEMDRATVEDRSVSEILEAHEAQKRLAAIGGGNTILMQWNPGDPLEPVPVGQIADKAAAFVQSCPGLADLTGWAETNAQGLRQFWAHSRTDALALKQIIEARKRELMTPVAARATP